MREVKKHEVVREGGLSFFWGNRAGCFQFEEQIRKRSCAGDKNKTPRNMNNFKGVEMVLGDGIEPPTRGFSVLCSKNSKK